MTAKKENQVRLPHRRRSERVRSVYVAHVLVLASSGNHEATGLHDFRDR